MLFLSSAAVVNAPITTPYFFQHVLPSLWERVSQLVAAPASNPEMLWIALPLIVTLFTMEFYFGRYRRESLGWNTSVGNSLVLVFVSLDLLRQIYGSASINAVAEVFSLNPSKTILAVAVGLSGLFILYYDFFHLLPKRFAFTISSYLGVNLLAYFSAAVIYADLRIDWYTLFAALLFFLFAAIFFAVVRRVEPKPRERYYVSRAERLVIRLLGPLEKAQGKRKARKRNIHMLTTRE
ncbi:hypothetical protein HYY73_05260 [Candidatus Woesearchaeota archaeon]|nr:hypothetical protein [Candidatus Woesearchaeota archaeon]